MKRLEFQPFDGALVCTQAAPEFVEMQYRTALTDRCQSSPIG